MKEYINVKSHTTGPMIPLALSLLSAGAGYEVSEDFDLLDVNNFITRGRDGFIAFILDGTSMVPTIRPGDMVFVDTWAEPKNGDKIVSSINGLLTVKIFENSGRGLFLVPKNGDFAEREVRPNDNFRIIGVVRAHLAIY